VNQGAITKSNGMILNEASGTVSIRKRSWVLQGLGLWKMLSRD